MSALHRAIVNDRMRQIQLLLAVGMNVNTRDRQGRTPLMIACFMRNLKRREMVCQLLLDFKADIEALDASGRCIIMYACATRNEFLLDSLLQCIDTDLNQTDKDGNTSLMYSAIEGDVKILRKLVSIMKQYGLSLDVRNKRGFTAYLLALKYGNVECANILRENEASVNIVDLENFWDGDQWIKKHYVQRLRRESMQMDHRMRSQSVSTKRCEDEVKLIERPKSMPPIFSPPKTGTARACLCHRKLQRSVSSSKAEDIQLTLKKLSGCVKFSPDLSKSVIPENDNDEISIQTRGISRPQTVSTFRSDVTSIAGDSEYLESVSTVTQRRKNSNTQSKELIKIFEQYSLSQMPLPPASAKVKAYKYDEYKTMKGNEHRINDLPMTSLAVNATRHRRQSTVLRQKARNVKTEVKVLTALQSDHKENSRLKR